MRLKKEIKSMLTDRKIVQELIAGKSNRVISIEFKTCHKRVARLRKLAYEYGYLDKKIELLTRAFEVAAFGVAGWKR